MGEILLFFRSSLLSICLKEKRRRRKEERIYSVFIWESVSLEFLNRFFREIREISDLISLSREVMDRLRFF